MYRVRYKKYGNKKTTASDGYKYDSKFEAGVAEDLILRMKAKEILDFDRQYKIECIPYNCDGAAVPQCKVSHKVDFRIHELDGTYTLLEAKGLAMSDWRRRVKWLENFWLPAHLDHVYEVIYNR